MVLLENTMVKPKLHGAKMKRVLRFTASWCQPCKAMAKTLEEINLDLDLPIEVIDIDVHSDIAMDYGIRSVPTLVMKESNIEVKRLVGLRTKQELTEWFNG